jgi:hypothetical protein
MAKHMADSLASIYQTHMVKRLESSFDAFRRSLHTLLDATRGMIKMFQEDKVIIAPELNVKKLQSDGVELDEIIELAIGKGFDQKEILFHAADFKPEFLPMLEYDAKVLDELCKRWDKVKSDPKLELFVNMLQGELFDKEKNPGGKLVVFSESVDTVNYLEKELKERLQRNDILAVCAKNRKRLQKTIQANFDAKYKEEWHDDYNIIITSDVLAEGVNLHRANVVVNYDSPWNATRLMQRIGRVNRIGSTAKAIHNYMFYPSDPGDAIISLKKNSLIKLQSFHSALGEDTKSIRTTNWYTSSNSSTLMCSTKPTEVWNCCAKYVPFTTTTPSSTAVSSSCHRRVVVPVSERRHITPSSICLLPSKKLSTSSVTPPASSPSLKPPTYLMRNPMKKQCHSETAQISTTRKYRPH